MERLGREFFDRSCVEVAKELLGHILVFNNYQGIITETEAYRGADDPASHAFRGITPRTKVMFGIPGKSYVYLIYGMYYCLNIVTEEEGSPSAVLLRGLKLIQPAQKLLDGPGKICRELQINKLHNELDLINHESFYVSRGTAINDPKITSRIGIKVGNDKLWRFVANI